MVSEIASTKLNWRVWRKRLFKARYIYLLLLPGIVYYLIFSYVPMYGILLAFKDYKANLGILGSPFIGLRNYEFVFNDPQFFGAVKNTLIISFQRLVIEFPAPIILAILLNEVQARRYKRTLQTIFTFPHFLSWVIVSGILVNILGNEGAVNNLISLFGAERQAFLANSALFRSILYFTNIWKESGWSAIIYLAAISGINQELYEAAYIDGANRLQRILYITLPGIASTISILFILGVGNAMNAGFDQIFNLYSAPVYDVSDILDTYIYRITFQGPADFGFSTAVGLFKSAINFLLLVICNKIVKTLGGTGLFY